MLKIKGSGDNVKLYDSDGNMINIPCEEITITFLPQEPARAVIRVFCDVDIDALPQYEELDHDRFGRHKG